MLFYQKEYQNKNNNTHFVKLLFKKFVFPYSLLFLQVFKAFFFFIVAFPFFINKHFRLLKGEEFHICKELIDFYA
ncbi:hypothetical protein CU019_1429 [Enterococcus faecium]|nr:hypothetical protein [Enterococcus faecium]MBK4798630.1 hypothetical protein [Enterococcus faecium]MBK4819939.1 hypothetical protein [Enterococcus faecium]MBK4869614.1 hypothetical protein [Enterococcus faecium]